MVGWRWLVANGVALGVVLTAILCWDVLGEGVAEVGGSVMLWDALAGCVLAGLLATLRTGRVMDAVAVGLVAGPAGCALAVLSMAALTHDARWLTGLVFLPGVVVAGALCATVGGGFAVPLRRLLGARAGQR